MQNLNKIYGAVQELKAFLLKYIDLGKASSPFYMPVAGQCLQNLIQIYHAVQEL